MWNLYGIWWVDSRIGICGFKSSWFPLWQDDPKNDFVNTHDAPYDDVRFLGTKKRSGAIFSKFQKATGEGKRPEVWRCPKYMLFGVTRITKSFVFFFSNWNLIPTRKKMMIHSTKQFARYEGLWRFPNFGDTGRDTPKNHLGFHRIFHEWHQPSVFGPNLWRHYVMDLKKSMVRPGQDTLDGDSWKNNEIAAGGSKMFTQSITQPRLWDSDPKLVHISPVFQWALVPPTRSRKTHGFQPGNFRIRLSISYAAGETNESQQWCFALQPKERWLPWSWADFGATSQKTWKSHGRFTRKIILF